MFGRQRINPELSALKDENRILKAMIDHQNSSAKLIDVDKHDGAIHLTFERNEKLTVLSFYATWDHDVASIKKELINE